MSDKDDRITTKSLVKSLAAEHNVSDADIKLLDWSTKAGSGDTDNFATDMVAVNGKATVSGKEVAFSYMAKVLPNGKMRQEMVKKVNNSL